MPRGETGIGMRPEAGTWVENAMLVTQALRDQKKEAKDLTEELKQLRIEFAAFKAEMTVRTGFYSAVIALVVTIAVNWKAG